MSRVPPCFRLSNWRCHGVTHFQERSSTRHRPGSAGGIASWLLAVGASPFPGPLSVAFSTAPPLSSHVPACSVGSVEQSLCEWGIFCCDFLIIISGGKGSDRCPVLFCAACRALAHIPTALSKVAASEHAVRAVRSLWECVGQVFHVCFSKRQGMCDVTLSAHQFLI